MKKLFTILFTTLLLAATACQHKDIWNELRDHEQRIEQLEQQCRELNSNIEAVQAILAAVQQNDYVTEVMKVMEDGVEVGYSITFSKSGTITIYHGTDGTDGADGGTPNIGIKKAADGAYYWTSNGEWITDDDGNKIPATVSDPNATYVTPQFRVADGVWYVSYDNGNSWREIEAGSDQEGDSFFRNVTTDSENLYLTLADGTVVTVPIVSTSRSFVGKVISIMGDSISTFEGWIPIEDGHNLNHRKRYPQANLFNDVRLTWWHMLITNLGAKLGVNDSWAGSMVSNTATTNSGDLGPDACMSSVTRITNLGSNGTPDLIFFYGGTNDAARNVPMGTFDPSKFQQVDLTTTTWSTFADAYAVAIMRMQYYYPDAKIIAMTPTWTTSYYTPQRLNEVAKMIEEVCDYYGVPVVDLRKCGINQNNLDKTLGDGIHPSALGMEMIEKYLRKQLLSFYEGDFTENIVYKVTDNLTSAVNLDRYITGVSAGRPYTAQLSGDLSKIGVKMGGNDVTADSFNASTGQIHIPEVTGDVHIDESVEHEIVETTWYIDHTKNKSKFTSSCNTGGRGWAIADTNPAYSQLIGKPINTAAFFTNKTSQTVTVMKVPSYRATSGEVIATVTATIPAASKQLAVIYFPEVTLKEGEYLSLFSQEDANIQFYYTSAAVEDAYGVVDNGFYTRLPILYGSGTNWSLADMSCLGWSFGYTNHCAGKKVTCVGDSITAGSGTTKTYWSILYDTLELESMTGMGVAGSCVSATSDYKTGNSPLINRYKSIPDSDIITIYMGTNDYGHETPMGTIDDTEDVSFYGALNVIIPGIQKAHPDALLAWITPTHRYGFGTSKILGTAFTYDYLPNGRGYSLNDYVDAIKEVCEKYDVPVIDLFTLSGMDPSLSEVRTQYMPDGLHPNAAGHEKIAAIISQSLGNILLAKNL